MKNRNTLLLISLLLALATAGAALFWLKTQSSASEQSVEKVALWTAKEDIPAGTLITDKMLEKSMIANELLPADVYTDSKEIVGRYAKDTIIKGESFPQQRLYSDADKLLSMKLEPGFRAFSISMTQFSGVADLIKPGDRVDVFVFMKELADDSGVIRSDVAQVLLQDVEVLAVRRETKVDSAAPETRPELYAVTVAVPVKSVEKLILGEETALLKIALRPLEEKTTYNSYGVVWKELLLDPNLNIRDFEPEYGTVGDQKALTGVRTIQDVSAPVLATSTSAPDSVEPKAVPKAAPKAIPKTGYSTYTVAAGDTLMSISRQFFNGSASHYKDIMRINGLSDQAIKPGQKLKIPLAGR